MTNLFFQHSGWWLLLIIIIAAAISGFLYFYQSKFTKSQRWFLATLRFLALVLIALFLLEPMLKSESLRDEKPLLIWLQDNSQSIVAAGDTLRAKSFLRQDIKDFNQSLADKYEVVRYVFDTELKSSNLTFDGEETDISKALEEVQGRYYNQNVGGVILASDGIYNRGANPLYQARSSSFPIYGVGLGDTVQRKDLQIENLVHNEVSYQGSRFPLDININAYELSSKSFSIEVIDQDGKAVFSKQVPIKSNSFFHKESLFIEPSQSGLKRYTVRLSELEGENSLANNTGSFIIDVIDRKKQIAILGSGIHPDLAALTKALQSNKNYEITTGLLDKLENLSSFDLIILHLPGKPELEAIQGLTVPSLLFAGAETDVSALANRGVEFSRKGGSESVFNKLNESFTLFQLNENERDFLSDLPPVQSPYGEYKSQAQQILLYQRVGQVNTDRPLMAFNQKGEIRQGLFMGSGIWRWRMYNYREQQNFKAFDGFWLKAVQYLTTNVNKRRFVVETEAEYNEGEAVKINARLFNPSFELVNEPEVNFELRNETGEDFNYAFNRTEAAYQLQINDLPAGVYSWRSNTQLGAENFEQSGSFAVLDLSIENKNTVANHQLLKNMAQASGGAFFTLNDLVQLKESLLNNENAYTISYADQSIDSLLERWWIFFLILALLATEWALRKYWGNY